MFLHDTIVSFTEAENSHINGLIADFVKKLSGTNQSVDHYEKKRRVNRDKAAADIFLSKKTEWAVAKLLAQSYNYCMMEPDLQVYTKRKKSWAADLPYRSTGLGAVDVHVKACSASTYRYVSDWSWTWNLRDCDNRGGTDELFRNHNDDLVALAYMEEPKACEVTVKAILPWVNLVKLLKPPLKPTLQGLKLCLYWNDLLLNERK